MPGVSVVLDELPPGLLDGLPAEDQLAICGIVGNPVLLKDYDDEGRAELEFTDSHGTTHHIYVNPDVIRIA
jgi:hypothetical protein